MAAGMTTPRSFAPGEIPASPRAVSESFDEIFSNKGKVQTKPPCSFRGEPAVFFTKEEIVSLISPFRFTLVGKFPLWQPSMETVRKFFSSLELKSLKSVGLLHDNHIVIFINCEEDYSRLLIRSTWYVYGAPLKIQKWTPDYVPSIESLGFPSLPIHFFDKSALFNIASLFGTPLKVDEPTALLSRPTVARVCIEMDVSKPRKESFWIGSEKDGFWQEVVYENPPLYCDCCNVFEHVVDSCLFLQPELKKEKEMEEEMEEIRGKNTKKTIFQEPTCAVSKKENVAEVEVMPKENQFSFVTDQKDEWQIKKFRKWKQKLIPAEIPVAPVLEAASTAGSPAEPSADSRFRVVASPSAPFSNAVFVTPPNPNRLSPNFKSKVKERRGQPLDQEISIFQPLDRTEMPKSGNFKSYGVVNNSGSLDIFCKNFQSLDQSKGDKETGLVLNDGPVKKISAIKSSPSFSLDDNGLILKDGSIKSVAEIDSSPLDLFPNGLDNTPLYFSSSLDPMLEESQFGPNPNLQTNSTGQIAIPFPDESLSQIISSREKKVYPRYSLLHLKSFIFSSLRDQGIDLNPSLENGICDFLAFVAPKLYEENSYITWYFIQQRLISYLIDSKIFVSKKLRKAFGVFFTKSCNENQSTRLLENCVEDSPTSDEER